MPWSSLPSLLWMEAFHPRSTSGGPSALSIVQKHDSTQCLKPGRAHAEARKISCFAAAVFLGVPLSQPLVLGYRARKDSAEQSTVVPQEQLCFSSGVRPRCAIEVGLLCSGGRAGAPPARPWR